METTLAGVAPCMTKDGGKVLEKTRKRYIDTIQS